MSMMSGWRRAYAVVALIATTVIGGWGQTFENLAVFGGPNGANPYLMALVQGTNGNFYGTTSSGGTGSFGGLIFQITSSGTLTTVLDIDDMPLSGLALGNDGNFYGTTQLGGNCDLEAGCGTIFKVTPEGTLTVLHTFDGADGTYPAAVLLLGADGNFYGTTDQGGLYSQGVVFRISPGGRFRMLHSFGGGDGPSPIAGLVQSTDGNFYGTTGVGGNLGCNPPNGCGTVFKMTPWGALTTLYAFCSQPNCADGSFPYAGLVQAANGNFYGTTAAAGNQACQGNLNYSGCGTVFKITPGGVLTTLHTFMSSDGAAPVAGLVEATDGNFYGTTTIGGNLTCNPPNGCGTVFEITPDGTLTTLHSFDDNGDGVYPFGGLLQGTDGAFYGATFEGGYESEGTVFRLSTGLGPFVAFVDGSAKVGRTGGILGQGFTGVTSVLLDSTPVSFAVQSDTFLTATVPAGATTGLVTVTTPSGTLTSNKIFRVTPQVLSFNPPSGPVGTVVTITGVSLTQTTGVGFGDRRPATFTVNSDVQITATVPSGAKTGPVGIETQGGTALSTTIFTVTQ